MSGNNERTAEWLNQNANRRYPFVEDSSLLSVGGILLPDSFLLDFNSVLYDTAQDGIQLQSVIVSGTGPWTVIVTFETTISGTPIVFTLSTASSFPYVTQIAASGLHTTVAAFGDGVQTLAEQYGAMTHVFGAPLEPARICIQSYRRVNSVLGTKLGSVPVTGDIYIKEGYNCSLALIPGINAVRVNAVLGAGRGQLCDPQPSAQLGCDKVFLRINGLHADDAGNFVLQPGAGMKMTNDPTNHRIVLETGKPREETLCKESS